MTFTSPRRRTGMAALAGATVLMTLAVGTATAPALRPQVASANYSCRSTLLGRQSLPVSITGTTPPTVGIPFGEVSMSGLQATITIPASALAKVIAKGATTVTPTVTTFDINATDARVKTMNIALSPIAVSPTTTTLVAGQPVVFEVPAPATTTGTWAAKKLGTMTFNSGNVTIALNFGSAGSTTASCRSKPPEVISTTTVT